MQEGHGPLYTFPDKGKLSLHELQFVHQDEIRARLERVSHATFQVPAA